MFRWLHPTTSEAYTNWCTLTGARATNYGSRIDYIFADAGLIPSIHSCSILADVEGSDHCPVRAEFNVGVLAARKCPSLCTKYLPQFAGRQQTLATFFRKGNELQHEHHSLSGCTSQSVESVDSSPELLACKITQSELSDCGLQSVKRCAETNVADVSENCESSRGVLNKRMKVTSTNKQKSLLTFIGRHSVPDSKKPTTRKPQISSATNKVSADAWENASQLLDVRLRSDETATRWKTLLKGPPTAPLCRGHQEPCVLRTVKKEGPNKGKQFWVCCKPEGPKNHAQARCDHFVWVSNKS